MSKTNGLKVIRVAILVEGGEAAILKSSDNGVTWSPDTGYRYSEGEERSPSDPQVIYQSTVSFFRRSTDGGQHWVEPELRINGLKREDFVRKVGGADGAKIQVILSAIQPKHPLTIYGFLGVQSKSIATHSFYFVPGLYVSHDGGDDWFVFSKRLSVDTPLGISPTNPNVMMARADQGLVRSIDGGETWGPVGEQAQLEGRAKSRPREEGLAQMARKGRRIINKDPESLKFGVTEIQFDPADASIVYVVSNKGLYRSLNGGNTWCLLDAGNLMLGAVKSLVFDPHHSNTIFVGTIDRVLVSDDRGCHFRTIYRWERGASGDTGGGPGGGNPLAKANFIISLILATKNECSDFFNSSGDLNQGLTVETAFDAFASDTIQVSAKPMESQLIGAKTTQDTGFRSSITVNSNGFMMQGFSSGTAKPLPGVEGTTFSAGQIGTQVVGLLHELAHTLGVVPPDAGKTAQSQANTATIVANCLPAILAALKSVH